MSRNRLAQELPPGSAVEFSHYPRAYMYLLPFFYRRIGLFVVLVDARQNQVCRTTFQRFNVPEPKPKPKPKPALKPKAAPKPGPKGQHREEFRMVYHRKKGFTSEPVEH